MAGESLKSKAIELAAQPTIQSCRQALVEANALLDLKDKKLPTEGLETHLRNLITKATSSQRLLQLKQASLQRQYSRWEKLVADPGTTPDKAEIEAFATMIADPQGLATTIEEVETTIQLLTCLEEDAKGQLQKLTGVAPTFSPAGTASQSPEVVATSAIRANVRLPQLELPFFEGGSCEWIEFWSLFSAAVDDQPQLTDVEKLVYLLGRLRGEAKLTVAGYSITAENYQAVLRDLKTRYGDSKEVAHRLQVELRRLFNPSHSSEELLRFHNEISRILYQMKAVNINVDNEHVIFDIEDHLPEKAKIAVYQEKKLHNEWNTELLKGVILEEARMLQEVRRNQSEKHKSVHYSDRNGNRQVPNRTSAFAATTPQSGLKNFNSGNRKKISKGVKHTNGGQRPSVPIATPISQAASQPSRPCYLCNGAHWTTLCTAYGTPEQRRRRLQELNMCTKCLKSTRSHDVRLCKSRPCFYCKMEHNQILCPNRQRTAQALAALTPQSEETIPVMAVAAVDKHTPEEQETTPLLLWVTAPVFNLTSPAQHVRARFFLDQGSQLSFISDDLARRLNLHETTPSSLVIKGIGGLDGSALKSRRVSLGVILINGRRLTINAHTLPKVTDKFLHAQISLSDYSDVWQQTQKLLPLPLSLGEPDILIGSDFITDINPRISKRLPSGFCLYDTELGPIIGGSGRVASQLRPPKDQQATSVIVGVVKVEVADLWKLETIGINSEEEATEDDALAQVSLNKSLTRLPDGRYSVGWPWKTGSPRLALNAGICIGRLQSLLRSLRGIPERLERYHATIMQQLKDGIIELAPANPSGALTHYIPHQCVWNEEKQKLRIVYDASASAPKGQSLNENLLRGPIFLPDLVGVLLRLRQPAVAIIADLEKAFLQIELNESDRDVTRFMWLPDPQQPISETNPVIAYRFKRIPFGVISSPFLLAAVVRHHLAQSSSPWAAQIAGSIYVDNVLLGASSVTEAEDAYNQAKHIFAEAKMRLCDFATNDATVRQKMASNDRHEGSPIKVLGIIWNTIQDSLHVRTHPPRLENVTRRSVLGFIAKHFDPLGLISPSVLPFKIFLQDLSREGPPWDEKISDALQTRWNAIRDQHPAGTVTIPRRLPADKDVQLHVFTDASCRAYAAAVFLRSATMQASPAHLVLAKCRLCPMQTLTIPRLELLGILIGVRLINFAAHQLRLDKPQKFLWTDSKCALAWLTSAKEDKLPRFVKNRLQEIHRTQDITYAYVQSADNPADIATRGCSVLDLAMEQKWWSGPTWLSSSRSQWPQLQPPPALPLEMLNDETPQDHVLSVATTQPFSHCSLMDTKRFSDWRHLVNVTAWALRFIRKLRQTSVPWLPPCSTTGPLNGDARKAAQILLLRQTQIDNVPPSDVQRWELQLDEHGLWRCEGRLVHTLLPKSMRNPIFLPQHHHVTELLILAEHQALLHGGVSTTLTRFRQKYWVRHGRRTVDSTLKRLCLECRRWKAKPFALPTMAPLPESRVQRSPAFSATAVDYFGPIVIKREDQTSKVWVALFTCLATRALHLELADDLSAFKFSHCLRRFMARRGVPDRLLSDNGTNFRLTAKALKAIPEAQDLDWEFITALAPWKGGVYERLVGVTKQALRRAIGRKLLTEGDLRTLCAEAEAVVNQRPLTYVKADSLQVIRPIDFIRPCGTLLINLPSSETGDHEYQPKGPSSRESLLEQWTSTQAVLNKFWTIWETEYLQLLRERNQRHLHRGPHAQTRRLPKVGEVVLLQGPPATPRSCWPLAEIIEACPSEDGNIRTAKIRTTNGRVFQRPITLLYPLEVIEEHHEDVSSTEADEAIPNPQPDPPTSPSPLRRITRSMTRAQGAPTAAHFVLTVLALLCATVISTHALSRYDCPRHGGVQLRLPHLQNCSQLQARETSVWTQATIYGRRHVLVPAISCSNHSRTVCTSSFLHWTLEVTADYTNVTAVSKEDCRLMDLLKQHRGHPMVQHSKDRWETNLPEGYSYGLWGTRCTTTSNFVIQYGSLAVYNNETLLTTTGGSSATCNASIGICYTDQTLMWDPSQVTAMCHFQSLGNFTVFATSHYVHANSLEASFVFERYDPVVSSCNLTNVHAMDNGFLIVFTDDKIQNDFREWIVTHPSEVAQLNWLQASQARIVPGTRRVSSGLKQNPKTLLAASMWTEDNFHDPINPKVQFVYDLLSDQINTQFRGVWMAVCELKNALIVQATGTSPTMAARMMLQREDIEAERQEDGTLLVFPCLKGTAGSLEVDDIPSSQRIAIHHHAFQAGTLPAPERERVNIALSLITAQIERLTKAGAPPDRHQKGAFDSLFDEGQRLLGAAERKVGKATHEIQHTLNEASAAVMRTVTSIVSIIAAIAAALLAVRYRKFWAPLRRCCRRPPHEANRERSPAPPPAERGTEDDGPDEQSPAQEIHLQPGQLRASYTPICVTA